MIAIRKRYETIKSINNSKQRKHSILNPSLQTHQLGFQVLRNIMEKWEEKQVVVLFLFVSMVTSVEGGLCWIGIRNEIRTNQLFFFLPSLQCQAIGRKRQFYFQRPFLHVSVPSLWFSQFERCFFFRANFDLSLYRSVKLGKNVGNGQRKTCNGIQFRFDRCVVSLPVDLFFDDERGGDRLSPLVNPPAGDKIETNRHWWASDRKPRSFCLLV